jgi:hypothetical protein
VAGVAGEDAVSEIEERIKEATLRRLRVKVSTHDRHAFVHVDAALPLRMTGTGPSSWARGRSNAAALEGLLAQLEEER